MKHISNIKDLKIMYITTSIGLIAYDIGMDFGLSEAFNNSINNLAYRTNVNYYIYSILISKFGGTSHIKFDPKEIHYFLKLNELIYDNFENKEKIIKKINIGNVVLDEFNENTMKILLGKGDKKKYYSLLFLAIPFALKINDKDKLVKKLHEFLLEITNNFEHILAVIICSLFINYALNGIEINKWIENINKDLNELNGIKIEKYLDSLNNYYELNFRNNNFVEQKIEYVVDRRNYYFIENYCNKNNRILSESPFEQVLLIYDTLIRSKDNWEKLILFGMVNFNDNVSVSIIIGCLYEILFSSRKVNKNLIKRFSF